MSSDVETLESYEQEFLGGQESDISGNSSGVDKQGEKMSEAIVQIGLVKAALKKQPIKGSECDI